MDGHSDDEYYIDGAVVRQVQQVGLHDVDGWWIDWPNNTLPFLLEVTADVKFHINPEIGPSGEESIRRGGWDPSEFLSLGAAHAGEGGNGFWCLMSIEVADAVHAILTAPACPRGEGEPTLARQPDGSWSFYL